MEMSNPGEITELHTHTHMQDSYCDIEWFKNNYVISKLRHNQPMVPSVIYVSK